MQVPNLYTDMILKMIMTITCIMVLLHYVGGDTEEDFARHHWMIDSGFTDHISPFLDDFAYLGNLV